MKRIVSFAMAAALVAACGLVEAVPRQGVERRAEERQGGEKQYRGRRHHRFNLLGEALPCQQIPAFCFASLD